MGRLRRQVVEEREEERGRELRLVCKMKKKVFKIRKKRNLIREITGNNKKECKP